jgi:hypothetical protein
MLIRPRTVCPRKFLFGRSSLDNVSFGWCIPVRFIPCCMGELTLFWARSGPVEAGHSWFCRCPWVGHIGQGRPVQGTHCPRNASSKKKIFWLNTPKSFMCTAVLISWVPAGRNPPSPSTRIWAHMRGRYWSAKIDDISLWPPVSNCKILYDTRCKWENTTTLYPRTAQTLH